MLESNCENLYIYFLYCVIRVSLIKFRWGKCDESVYVVKVSFDKLAAFASGKPAVARLRQAQFDGA